MDIEASEEQRHLDAIAKEAKLDALPGKHVFMLDNPEPYLPEGFFENLAEIHERYNHLYASKMQSSFHIARRRQASLSASGRGGYHIQLEDDHWLSWRQRMAVELMEEDVS